MFIQNPVSAALPSTQSLPKMPNGGKVGNHAQTLNSNPISNVTVLKGPATTNGLSVDRSLNSQPPSVQRIAHPQQQSVQSGKPTVATVPTQQVQHVAPVQHSQQQQPKSQQPQQQQMPKPHRHLSSAHEGTTTHQARPEETPKVQIVNVQPKTQTRVTEQPRVSQTDEPRRNATTSGPDMGKTHHGHAVRPQQVRIPAPAPGAGQHVTREV